MAPKKASKPIDPATEERKAAKVKQWRENAVFMPALFVGELKWRYAYVYSRKTKDHEGTVVLPGSAPPADDQYHFFTGYFYCGLCPPFSDFFIEVMRSYGFWLLDFAPNAITCMSVFAHLCENFIGVVPNVALFRHFFIPWIESDAPSESITWIPRAGLKKHYIEDKLNIKWKEWRADWCWIKQQNFPAFYKLRTEKIEKDADWSNVDPNDSKLGIALYKIISLKEA